DFYGGQVGLNLAWQRNRWDFELRPVVALGATRQRLSVDGQQDFTAPNGTVSTFTGGLLALPGNIRTETRTEFTVVPQVTLQIGYQVTSNLRAFVGYDYLWWSNVIR